MVLWVFKVQPAHQAQQADPVKWVAEVPQVLWVNQVQPVQAVVQV